MRPVTFARTLAAAAVGAVCASQTVGIPGNPLLINGTLATNGVAQLGAQQIIGITSGGNIAGVVFTVTGTDDQNRIISETITGVNTNTVNSVLNYRTITSIIASAVVASAITVDTVALGASSAIPLDLYLQNGHTVSVAVSGAVTYTVQVTNDNPYGSNPSVPLNWVPHPVGTLVGATTSQLGTTANAYRAVRLLTTTGTGTATITVTQQGLIV
jgi:hypothetical protein